jgi:Putative esterase
MKRPHSAAIRAALTALLFSSVAALPGQARGQTVTTRLRFEVSFPASVRSEAADGRLYVVVSRKDDPEPRLQFGKGGPQYRSSPFFGVDVESVRPGRRMVVDDRADGYPPERLHDLPPGDYWVQALLNLYTTFHRADGHVVKLHMDQWEGQVFQKSPGNLYSAPRKMHLDPRKGGVVHIVLDRKIPPIEVPADTQYVKHVRFESPRLSKFWGHPILIGATILLPRDYDRNLGVSYPVIYEQGHFSTTAPGGFQEKIEVPAGVSEPIKKRIEARAKAQHEFEQAWLSDGFPRMLLVTFQHPTPYYDDSYAIDSPNTGPYGKAIMEELIPYIEKHYRVIPHPYARILTGGSTGGWESLALQIFHPDDFGGTFSYCPDPVDFHFFEMINIYDWDNAFWRQEGFLRVPVPAERAPDGRVLSTMPQQGRYERALGSHERSGDDWSEWEAAYGPVGPDGYIAPVFDKATGKIDHKVAQYWKEHTDLNAYLQRNWKQIGPKLFGKIHIWAGDMDTYYLNDAVHPLDDFLSSVTDPPYGGTIAFGPGKPHCWSGPGDLADHLKMMAGYILAHVPRDVDPAWWRF